MPAFVTRYARLLLGSLSFLIVLLLVWMAVGELFTVNASVELVSAENLEASPEAVELLIAEYAHATRSFNLGFVLFFSPIIWLCHALALLWWARLESRVTWRGRLLRSGISAVLTLPLLALVLFAASLNARNQHRDGPAVVAGMILGVVIATAVAFRGYAVRDARRGSQTVD